MKDHELLAAIDRLGGNHACASCGGEDFDVYVDSLGDVARFWISAASGGIHAYMMTCSRCGAIRSFDANRIAELSDQVRK